MQPASTVAGGSVAVVHNPQHAAARTATPALRDVLDGLSTRQARPTPYSAVQQQLTAAAAVDGLIRVVGGPGTGKRHQARKWLRQHTGQEPWTITTDTLTEDGPAWTGMDAALRGGRGVVVVGGAGIPGELRSRLAEFAKAARTGVTPGARVILTERSGRASDNDDGTAGEIAPPVRLPSLVEQRTELPDVVREVSAELFPGGPAPRFSPAALQCLLAWHWPGNVAELSRLLADLHRSAGNGLIQTKDLPGPMRQTSWSALSRYEQSERDAIVSALAEADGNKSRAAEILGIGRTTLYRKMRALKIDDDERMVAPGA